MSTDTDPAKRIHAAEIALDQDESDAALKALIEAVKESCDDPNRLIDAGHELKSYGMKLRRDSENRGGE